MGKCPGSARFFSSSRRPDRLWGPTQPHIQWVQGVGGKAAGAWSWPLPSSAEIKNGEAITPFLICLHGIVLDQLSTRTTLLFIRRSDICPAVCPFIQRHVICPKVVDYIFIKLYVTDPYWKLWYLLYRKSKLKYTIFSKNSSSYVI
jgi:hypothetical protein